MRRAGIQPDIVTYKAVLAACEQADGIGGPQLAKVRALLAAARGVAVSAARPGSAGTASAGGAGAQLGSLLVEASELLAWHQALDSGAAGAFGRAVYLPARPRLYRLARAEEAPPEGALLDALGRQFGLGEASTRAALLHARARLGELAAWAPRARRVSREVLVPAVPGGGAADRPTSKTLSGWCAHALSARGAGSLACQGRTAGYGSPGGGRQGDRALLAPVFVEHDRSHHAERTALLGTIWAIAAQL